MERRSIGIQIVHAPSECGVFYKDFKQLHALHAWKYEKDAWQQVVTREPQDVGFVWNKATWLFENFDPTGKKLYEQTTDDDDKTPLPPGWTQPYKNDLRQHKDIRIADQIAIWACFEPRQNQRARRSVQDCRPFYLPGGLYALRASTACFRTWKISSWVNRRVALRSGELLLLLQRQKLLLRHQDQEHQKSPMRQGLRQGCHKKRSSLPPALSITFLAASCRLVVGNSIHSLLV